MTADQWTGLASLIIGVFLLISGVLLRLADGEESIDSTLDRAVYISAGACIVLGVYFLLGN